MSETIEEQTYHGMLAGKPTRTAEVKAPNGTSTVEEGTLTFELATKDSLREAQQEQGWTVHYVGPDGGVGFGLDDGNSGGVVVPYDLVEVIPFPRPMTEDEANDWWDDERMKTWAEENGHTDTAPEAEQNGGENVE